MKVKCNECKKKINIVFQFKCKCSSEKVFCNYHRNNHNCEYDYKNNQKNTLEKDNPIIIPLKIQKI